MPRAFEKLGDNFIEGALGFYRHEKVALVFWDTIVHGLVVRIGRNRTTFSFSRQTQTHGKRRTHKKRLGFWPAMNVKDARAAALAESAKIAAGRGEPGRREAVSVATVINAYIAHCRQKGKPGSGWPAKVQLIANKHILPEFGDWSLHDLAMLPERVADWHSSMPRVIGNRAAMILGSAYRLRARIDRTLPAFSPTSAVVFNREHARQVTMDWSAWSKAWLAIDDRVVRSFHLVNLLGGFRPGELQRAVVRGRSILVPVAKAGSDILVPLSREMIAALRLAKGGSTAWASARDSRKAPGLPVYGHALRHVFASTAKAIGVDTLILKLLLGHSVSGDVTHGYVGQTMLRPVLRREQGRVSAEIMKRLGLDSRNIQPARKIFDQRSDARRRRVKPH